MINNSAERNNRGLLFGWLSSSHFFAQTNVHANSQRSLKRPTCFRKLNASNLCLIMAKAFLKVQSF